MRRRPLYKPGRFCAMEEYLGPIIIPPSTAICRARSAEVKIIVSIRDARCAALYMPSAARRDSL